MHYKLLNSKNLGDVLEGLYKINPQLLTKENFALLAKRGHNLDEVACLFAGLREIKHPQLLVTKESFDLLTKNWGDFYATATADALQVINKISPQLLTEENFTLLLQNGYYASAIGAVLYKLNKRNPQLVTQETLNLLLQNGYYLHPPFGDDMPLTLKFIKTLDWWQCGRTARINEYKCSISYALDGLYKINPQLLTNETFNLLVKYAEGAERANDVEKIVNALSDLHVINPQFVTNETIGTLIRFMLKNDSENMNELIKLAESHVNQTQQSKDSSLTMNFFKDRGKDNSPNQCENGQRKTLSEAECRELVSGLMKL